MLKKKDQWIDLKKEEDEVTRRMNFLSIVFTVIMCLSVFSNYVWGEKWIYLGQNEKGTTFFYEINNFNKADLTVTVQVKTHIEPDMKVYTDCLMNEKQTRKCEYLSHSITQYEIKCLYDLFRRVKTKDYDSEGKVTHSDDSKYEFQSIPKDSVIDELKKIVCK